MQVVKFGGSKRIFPYCYAIILTVQSFDINQWSSVRKLCEAYAFPKET